MLDDATNEPIIFFLDIVFLGELLKIDVKDNLSYVTSPVAIILLEAVSDYDECETILILRQRRDLINTVKCTSKGHSTLQATSNECSQI